MCSFVMIHFVLFQTKMSLLRFKSALKKIEVKCLFHSHLMSKYRVSQVKNNSSNPVFWVGSVLLRVIAAYYPKLGYNNTSSTTSTVIITVNKNTCSKLPAKL